MQWNDSLRAEAERATFMRAVWQSGERVGELEAAPLQFVQALWTIERCVNEVRRTRDRLFTVSHLPELRHASRAGHDMIGALTRIARNEQKNKGWAFAPYVDHALDAAESLGLDLALGKADGRWTAQSVDPLNRWIAAIRAVEGSDLRGHQVREFWRNRWNALQGVRGFLTDAMSRRGESSLVQLELSTPVGTIPAAVFMRGAVDYLFRLRTRLKAMELDIAWKWDGQGEGILIAHLILVIPRAFAATPSDLDAIALEAWEATLGIAAGVNPPRLIWDTALPPWSGNVDHLPNGRRRSASVFLVYGDAMNGVKSFGTVTQLGFGSVEAMAQQAGLPPRSHVHIARQSMRTAAGHHDAPDLVPDTMEQVGRSKLEDDAPETKPEPSTLLPAPQPGWRAPIPKPSIFTPNSQPSELLSMARSMTPSSPTSTGESAARADGGLAS